MSHAETELTALRRDIDTVDAQLVALLKTRIGIVKKVGALKQAHWPNACHIRPAREAQMHRAIFGAFGESDFLPEAAVAMWRHIISASTHTESPLHIATPDALAPLAHGYFGAYVNHLPWNNGALPEHATIAILPFPNETNAAQWHDFAGAHPNWRIFAYLPVVLHSAQPQALALAPVQCEPSGDDISYFSGAEIPAHATQHAATIWSVAGFVTEMPGATFLGAHGVPITRTKD